MPTRYWPLGAGRVITSPFGPRPGGFHTGVDFGRAGGSAGMPIYAVQSGTVIFAGAAQGYGGPDPAGWLVVDSSEAEGGGCLEYGHLVREVAKGDHVTAGQRIAHINPDQRTNAGVAPHLHLSDMPGGYDAGAKQDPMPRLRNALEPGITPNPPPVVKEPAVPAIANPVNRSRLSPNRSVGRGGVTPRWIVWHTQEGGLTAWDLAGFTANPASQVSYNGCVDDVEIILTVDWANKPWSAANANAYAYHLCAAGSYAAWSRGKWLEKDASDGKNEDAELTNLARVSAWLCQQHDIPATYIGGHGIPWGSDGICGHMDFGAWGGGHHDPGQNFPWDEGIRRVRAFLGGAAPVPLPTPVPIGPGGGTPVDPATSPYFTGVLYLASEGPQVTELQRRLKAAYSSYAGQLPVDGDFGPLTDAAVRVFQSRSGLTVDGIVGPQTAAALKLKKV